VYGTLCLYVQRNFILWMYMHAGRRDAATDRRLDSCVVYSASVKMSGAANDDDDDKAPMIVHEWPMPAATASHHSSDVTRPAGALDVVTRRRFTSLCLAIVTLILFTCALIFLVVCLIIPVMHSTAMQQQQQQQQHHNRSSSPASAADHDDEHHQHSRPMRQVVTDCAFCPIINHFFDRLITTSKPRPHSIT